MQTIGWQADPNKSATWKKDGEFCGTTGNAKRLEAIQIELYGEMAEHYDIYYRVHSQTYGWMKWAKNGEMSGTTGQHKRIEGIQVVLVKKVNRHLRIITRELLQIQQKHFSQNRNYR